MKNQQQTKDNITKNKALILLVYVCDNYSVMNSVHVLKYVLDLTPVSKRVYMYQQTVN